jgi:hypothetical protein
MLTLEDGGMDPGFSTIYEFISSLMVYTAHTQDHLPVLKGGGGGGG